MSIHASAVTFTTYVSDLNEDLWNNIKIVGNLQNENNFSSNVSLKKVSISNSLVNHSNCMLILPMF